VLGGENVDLEMPKILERFEESRQKTFSNAKGLKRAR
jgi:hypothetical protein